MQRFIAFVWDPHSGDISSRAQSLVNPLRKAASEWTELLSVKGMAVFSLTRQHPNLQTHLLPGNAGIILGRLFPRDSTTWSPAWKAQFSDKSVSTFLSHTDESFIKQYWGGYIALFCCASGKRYKILRDCSGGIPCYRAEQDSVHVFFSDVSDLEAAGISRNVIDWRYLAAFIYSCDMQVKNTALFGVTELLAGEAVEITGSSMRQYSAWDPRAIVKEESFDNYDQAKALLTSTTQFCIDAWASTFRTITHRLSGGLDSSVVLGTLIRAPTHPDILCTHQFSDHARDDERIYARLAAAAANVRLLEQPRQREKRQFNAGLIRGQIFPRPDIQAMFRSFDLEVNSKVATEFHTDVTWTGQGGDHLFFQAQTSLGAADYIFRNGVNLGLIGVVRDSARLAREPYVSVLRSAWALGRTGGVLNAENALNRLNHTVHFVNREALPDDLDQYSAHAWNTQSTDIPQGKQFQIFTLTELLNRHRPTPSVEPVPEHHPLISQPLIELCLRIPTYELLRGGRQRALAREAFADRVPGEILRREDKGDTSTVVADTIRRSEPFLSQILLDGLLVKHNVIRRQAIEPYIARGQSYRKEHMWPLLSCVATELWARAWTESGAAANS